MSESTALPAADTVGDEVNLLTTALMTMPEGMWGLLITAVDLPADDQSTPTEYTGLWCHGPQPEAADRVGDVVLRLTPTGDDLVHVHALLAWQGRWQPAGTWSSADTSWPADIATAVATVMALHAALPDETTTA